MSNKSAWFFKGTGKTCELCFEEGEYMGTCVVCGQSMCDGCGYYDDPRPSSNNNGGYACRRCALSWSGGVADNKPYVSIRKIYKDQRMANILAPPDIPLPEKKLNKN